MAITLKKSCLKEGCPPEFIAQEEGFEAFAQTYDLHFDRVYELVIGLTHEALRAGDVDAAIGYATDGKIKELDLAGAAAGYLLEREHLRFHTGGLRWQMPARIITGLAGIILIMLVLRTMLSAAGPLPTFALHALATFWIVYLAPLLFMKTGLAGPIPAHTEPG